MKNLDQIEKNVYGDITEKSFIVYYNADLNDIAPFMCSPFSEGWFWANNTKDLVNYIFEIIIANYLINDVMAFGDFNNINDEDFDFLMSIEIYKEYKTVNKQRTKSISELVDLYTKNIDKELTYFEFVKLLINIEKCSPGAGIELILESYSTPLETRYSKNLNIEEFDFINLRNNY